VVNDRHINNFGAPLFEHAPAVCNQVRHLGIDPTEADAVNSVSGRIAEQMAKGACRLFGADVAAATTGYAEASPQWDVAVPFAWWGVARRLPGGDFAALSGRLDCPGLSRVEVQERVAAAALDALVAWVTERAG